MSTILVIHIVTFIISIALTSTTLLRSVSGHKISRKLSTVNGVITATGVATGITLLYSNPLSLQCALLFGYVLVFALTSVYAARRNNQLSLSAES